MAKKKKEEKQGTKQRKKRGRKKKDPAADVLMNEEDALENITGDEDYINIQSSGVVVEEGGKTPRKETEEEEPIYEEDVEEQAVKEVITGEITEHDLDEDTLPRYDEITESEFTVGDKVVHPKYGEGTILGQFGEGDFLKVYVNFSKTATQNSKVRLFLVKEANLKKKEKKKTKKRSSK